MDSNYFIRDEIRDKKYDCRTALSRPRSVIAPTMFGVGIEMDHVFGLNPTLWGWKLEGSMLHPVILLKFVC